MRKNICFLNSPAFRWFGHHIADDGLVPAMDVSIYWNQFAPWRVRDVAVIYCPRELNAMKGTRHPLWTFQKAFLKPLRMSSGNCFSHWMSPDTDQTRFDPMYGCDPHHDPESLWRMFLQDGFLNDEEAKHALSEFARIRECDWARNPDHVLPPAKGLTTTEWAELNDLQEPGQNRSPAVSGTPLQCFHFSEIVADLSLPEDDDGVPM